MTLHAESSQKTQHTFEQKTTKGHRTTMFYAPLHSIYALYFLFIHNARYFLCFFSVFVILCFKNSFQCFYLFFLAAVAVLSGTALSGRSSLLSRHSFFFSCS